MIDFIWSIVNCQTQYCQIFYNCPNQVRKYGIKFDLNKTCLKCMKEKGATSFICSHSYSIYNIVKSILYNMHTQEHCFFTIIFSTREIFTFVIIQCVRCWCKIWIMCTIYIKNIVIEMLNVIAIFLSSINFSQINKLSIKYIL